MILGIAVIVLAVFTMVALAVIASRNVALFRAKRAVKGTHVADAASAHSLGSFGYKQELLRDMGGFSNFAVSFSVISILTGAVTLYGFGFNQGGPAVMGIGWPLVTIFVLLVAAAMAELASAIPTSGAVYHWSSILGGSGWGWFTGWMNLLGQVTILAAIDFGCAGFVGSLLFDSPTQAQLVAVFGVILLSHAVLNHIGIRWTAKLNDLSAIYHLVGVFAILVVLAYLTPTRPVSYLFDTSFSKATSVSTPYWFAFLIGLLQAQWTYTGYDASAHTSEETIDAEVRAPWGIFSSVAVSSVFGFLMLALVTLSIKDPEAVAAAKDSAFRVALEQAAGGFLGKALVWMVTLAMWFCGLAAVTASSRMLYAFSRDRAVPLSNQWAQVSTKFKTPAKAIWVVSLFAFLSALTPNVYAVVTSLSVIGLYVSYGTPLFLRVVAQLKGNWLEKDQGPWNLGKFSLSVNIVAVCWVIFITVLFMIAPSDITIVEGVVLTYATGKIFAVVCGALGLWYFFSVRKWFKGPGRAGSEVK